MLRVEAIKEEDALVLLKLLRIIRDNFQIPAYSFIRVEILKDKPFPLIEHSAFKTHMITYFNCNDELFEDAFYLMILYHIMYKASTNTHGRVFEKNFLNTVEEIKEYWGLRKGIFYHCIKESNMLEIEKCGICGGMTGNSIPPANPRVYEFVKFYHGYNKGDIITAICSTCLSYLLKDGVLKLQAK